MALACRHPQQPRSILIRLAKALPPVAQLSIFVAVTTSTYKLKGFRADDTLLVIDNQNSTFESVLLSATPQDFIALAVVDNDRPTLLDLKGPDVVLLEPLTFDLSFFNHAFDFARDTDIYAAPGPYAKPGSLAVFTHVYNDNTMLQVWAKYYAGIVPEKDLYVIDHTSTASPREVLAAAVNVVSIPRGPVDHRAIAQFCNTFQRFLLSQYRWVIHVDADEILVHARGWGHLKASLLDRQDEVIIKAAHGFDLVHDIASEPALDLAAPISLQRHRLVPAPLYAKPVLASVPVTWREGFHTVFESHVLVEDDDLWLIHLSYVDIGLQLEKSRKWASVEVTEKERLRHPHAYHRPAVAMDQARQLFTRVLATPSATTVPDWMRGMF